MLLLSLHRMIGLTCGWYDETQLTTIFKYRSYVTLKYWSVSKKFPSLKIKKCYFSWTEYPRRLSFSQFVVLIQGVQKKLYTFFLTYLPNAVTQKRFLRSIWNLMCEECLIWNLRTLKLKWFWQTISELLRLEDRWGKSV